MRIKIAHVFARPGGRDPRVRRTLNFFARKGFIDYDPLSHHYRDSLTLEEVLWTCENVAPELFELVPVARLRFPKHLRGTPPADLRPVLRALGRGATEGPHYRGHSYVYIRGWTQLRTRDHRATAELTTYVQYKIPVDLVRRLRVTAEKTQRSATEVVVEALKTFFA